MTRDELENLPFELKHKIIMSLFLITIGILVYGTTNYGWYLNELSTLFCDDRNNWTYRGLI